MGALIRNFFRLVMLSIKKKYFDKGIREHLADDYETVGILMGEWFYKLFLYILTIVVIYRRYTIVSTRQALARDWRVVRGNGSIIPHTLSRSPAARGPL